MSASFPTASARLLDADATISNQSTVPWAFLEFDDAGRRPRSSRDDDKARSDPLLGNNNYA